MLKMLGLTLVFSVYPLASVTVHNVLAEELLSGKKKSACEAILCLSTSKNPSECSPSLEEYFGITADTPWELLEARRNFLKQCPSSNQSPQMKTLVEAIVNGAGKCDVVSINAATTTTTYYGLGQKKSITSNQMPEYCSIYLHHEYTDFKGDTYPVYVGTPKDGGYWVETQNYDTALAAYEEKIKNKPKTNFWSFNSQ